jgi:hypothetical protein
MRGGGLNAEVRRDYGKRSSNGDERQQLPAWVVVPVPGRPGPPTSTYQHEPVLDAHVMTSKATSGEAVSRAGYGSLGWVWACRVA